MYCVTILGDFLIIAGIFCHPGSRKADSHGLQGSSTNQSADCWVLSLLILLFAV